MQGLEDPPPRLPQLKDQLLQAAGAAVTQVLETAEREGNPLLSLSKACPA